MFQKYLNRSVAHFCFQIGIQYHQHIMKSLQRYHQFEQLPVFNSSTMPSMKMLKRQGLEKSPCLIPHSDVNDLHRPFANFIFFFVFSIHGKYYIKHVGRYIRL